MAKVLKAKPLSGQEIDLNRWCVEMAMRWPVITSYGGNGGGYGGALPSQQSDADVIGRANKIMAWVRTRHS